MAIQRITHQTLKIIDFLLKATETTWGLEISKATGVKSATVYMLLARLEEDGWVTSKWDDSPKRGANRRIYKLTSAGKKQCEKLIKDHQTETKRSRLGGVRLGEIN